MAANSNIVIAFDLYGTLLSTESIAKELSTHFGKDKATGLAGLWRRYQLEYTWRLNSMDQYEPFSSITRNSLTHALAESGLSLDDDSIASLMKAYDSLSTFPDVTPALQALAKESSVTAVVFSNGTQTMVTNSVKSSPDLGPHASVFKDIVTVEEVKRLKPAPAVYYHLAEKVGKSKTKDAMGEMWLVSGNPFDVVGARSVGMQAAWVDRAGNGWVDQLVQEPSGKPTVVVRDLEQVVDAVKRHLGR
ncbi:hypothetical protein JMJ35_000045 [Cladonia borealis]|uniref:Haloacid dehalogenase n=1 Tax=Cladonia borealis TaxID=184061 RepID=A0AA39RAF7_9LECA|nr:hypothetical protein JMJ35_000045 [Cladonia borealis]